MDTLTTRTAAAVSAAIEAAGQTQLGVSEATGIPRATLIRRLRGLSPFTVAELEKIAEVLDTRVSILMGSAETTTEQVPA